MHAIPEKYACRCRFVMFYFGLVMIHYTNDILLPYLTGTGVKSQRSNAKSYG